MTKGTKHIISEEEKKERPQNTSLRKSIVSRIWFRKHTIKLNDLLAKEKIINKPSQLHII